VPSILAPAGISPSRTYLPKATNSLRATATIPIFRLRLVPSSKRRWYHFVSSLSGWNLSQPQAISIIRSRNSARPDLLIPCSRSSSPLLCGVGTKPTSAASWRRLEMSRHENISVERVQEVTGPIQEREQRRPAIIAAGEQPSGSLLAWRIMVACCICRRPICSVARAMRSNSRVNLSFNRVPNGLPAGV